MTDDSELLVGRFDKGFLIRVIGRGTMQTSPAFREFAIQCFAHPGAAVVVDMLDCEYLDSTFLGCLIGLQKRCEGDRERFVIVADDPARIRLFSISVLDRVLPLTDTCPPACGPMMPLDAPDVSVEELGEHVMHSHRLLAATGCEDATKFQAIADRLAEELQD